MAMCIHEVTIGMDDVVLIQSDGLWYWFCLYEDEDTLSADTNGPFDSNGLAILNYMKNYFDMEESRVIRGMKSRLANSGRAKEYFMDVQNDAKAPIKYQVSGQHVKEIESLIKSGDVSLRERRVVYQTKTGQPCTPAEVSDEKLIDAIAMTDDDDDDLFVQNVNAVKDGEREEIA